MGRPNPVSHYLLCNSGELGARLTKTAVPQYVAQDFIGREEELDRIRTFAASSRSAVLTVILFGLPVVGKSGALSFCHYLLSTHPPSPSVGKEIGGGV